MWASARSWCRFVRMSALPPAIGTHNGKFHTDEVFACWMLRQLPQFKDHTILRYIIPVSLQSLVEDLNPAWNDDKVSADVQFEKAMELVGNIFSEKLLYLHNNWMPARVIVERAIEKRFDVHPSGKVIFLEQCCPWKQHFFMLEEELGIGGKIVFALFPGDQDATNYRIQSVPLSESSEFENRWPLPQEWRSLRDQVLAKAIDVPSAIFVHTTGFIGGAKTKEDVIKMADKALKTPRKP